MRIARLDLLRYGHFTDTMLELAAAGTDLHIVFGPNEAGKSTARSAIGDFLFGFPARTPLDFLHAYSQLRLGARCEYVHGTIEAIRRKGRKDTLLDTNGDASKTLEAELDRVLAGADADFFSRMFSLDHAGLRRGADALIAPEANADAAVLAAGSGLADILAQRAQLAAEADALWAPNASQNRRYYQAETRIKAAETAIREHEVTVGQWQQRRDALQDAQNHYQALAEQRRGLDHQRHQLERIRRVTQPVRRYRTIGAELESMGEVPELPADARPGFEAARKADDDAALAIDQLNELVMRLEAEIEAIVDDPALRAEAETIERLAEQRPRIADACERQAEIAARLAALDAALAQDRAELGWADDNNTWPSAAVLADARRLIGEHGTREQALAHAETNLADTRERDAQLQAEYEAQGMAADTTALDAWLAARARESDLEAERRNARAALERLDRDIDRRLAALDPPVADTDALAALRVPAVTDVDAIGQRMVAADAMRIRRQESVDALDDEAEHARASHQRQQAAEALPSAEQLAALRQRRDACWTQVRRRYIEEKPPDLFDPADAIDIDAAAEHDPAAALDALLREADHLADQRFERAEAITRQAERARALAEREHALEQAIARRDQAQAACDTLAADWVALWQPAELEPRAPAAMREWLTRRGDLLDARAERAHAQARCDELDRRIDGHRSAVMRQLTALGADAAALAEESLAVLFERARHLSETERQRRDARQRSEQERRKLATNLAAQQQDRDDAAATLETWRTAWSDALAVLGLPEITALEAARSALDLLEGARQRAGEQRELATERDTLSARREHFEARLNEVLAATNRRADNNETPEQTVQRLAAALRQAQSDHRLLATRQADLEVNRQRIAEHQQARLQAQARLDALGEKAGTTDRAGLEHAISASERKRQLEAERAAEIDALEAQGDGQPIAELVEAVEASDADALREQVEALSEHIKDLETELNAARDARNTAKAEFDAVGGDNRAAIAAAERQTALADMQDAAERYLRVGTAALLLKWAGQRYSMDKQRPLIERGSTLMNMLTGGSIERLAGEFDERDELQIVGVRPDGDRVWPRGMSEGTRDQLYLALRVAAIEDYLTRAEPLPVIADDLFINFDDDRAMAGLDVLAGLAEQTQVLFFTHHQHLRDLAAGRLGRRVATHDL